MNKITLNASGNWFDADKCERFESKTENGILRQNALFITPERNFVSRKRESKDSIPNYTIINSAEARSWFRYNKYTQDETPEFLREFCVELELK